MLFHRDQHNRKRFSFLRRFARYSGAEREAIRRSQHFLIGTTLEFFALFFSLRFGVFVVVILESHIQSANFSGLAHSRTKLQNQHKSGTKTAMKVNFDTVLAIYWSAPRSSLLMFRLFAADCRMGHGLSMTTLSHSAACDRISISAFQISVSMSPRLLYQLNHRHLERAKKRQRKSQKMLAKYNV